MSGVIKSIKKVFKKVGKAIKKVAFSGAKLLKKVFNSKIGRIILTAAAIWFTAGTASAFFANPSGGLLTAMKTSAGNMWSTATSFVSGGSAGGGSSIASTAGNGAAAMGGNAASIAPGVGASLPAAEVAASTTAAAAPAAATGNGLISGIAAAAKANPTLAMMTAQGIGNAAAGYSKAKEAEKQREAEQARLDARGLYGQDQQGRGEDLSTGSGLLSQYLNQSPQTQAVTQSQVANSATVAPVAARVATPAELAAMRRKGLIANPTGV